MDSWQIVLLKLIFGATCGFLFALGMLCPCWKPGGGFAGLGFGSHYGCCHLPLFYVAIAVLVGILVFQNGFRLYDARCMIP